MNKQAQHYEFAGDKLKGGEATRAYRATQNHLQPKPGGVIPPLVGTKEVAAIFGWVRKNGSPNSGKVSEYVDREEARGWPGKLIPKPVQVLASGPVWRKSDIVKFKEGLQC